MDLQTTIPTDEEQTVTYPSSLTDTKALLQNDSSLVRRKQRTYETPNPWVQKRASESLNRFKKLESIYPVQTEYSPHI